VKVLIESRNSRGVQHSLPFPGSRVSFPGSRVLNNGRYHC
jgi:hypothetical protein